MKKLSCCLFFLLLYLLAFPAQALASARSGLLLWYHSVLPVLFPFMLISGLLIRFNLLDRVLPLVSRPFRFLFGCSQYGAFAILTGFLCGFPMGAKITCDLRSQGKISEKEAYVLYGFANNLSPSFILSFIAADQMQLPAWGGLFLCNILGSALLYGILSSGTLRRSGCPDSPERPESPGLPQRSALGPDLQDVFGAIDDCIYDTIRNTVRLGAYIVMFSLFSGALSLLLPSGSPALLLLTSCVEVSSGIHVAAAAPLSPCARIVLVSVLGAFGGFSALAQTASIASMDRKLFLHYTKSRVMITLLSALLSLVSLLFVCPFLSR